MFVFIYLLILIVLFGKSCILFFFKNWVEGFIFIVSKIKFMFILFLLFKMVFFIFLFFLNFKIEVFFFIIIFFCLR